MLSLKHLFRWGTRRPGDFLYLVTHLRTLVRLTASLLSDARLPVSLRLLPIAALGYLVLPTDVLADWFFPLFGFSDDFLVMYFCFKLFYKRCPPQLVQEHLRKIESTNR